MVDAFSLFDDHTPDKPKVRSLSDAQRRLIRDEFASLGIVTAAEQFALVEEFTGVRISRVTDLTEADAQSLLFALSGRAQRAGHARTGDSWADRDEDTWIDKL